MLREAVLRTIEYLRSEVLDEGEEASFMQIQANFANANLSGERDYGLFAWVREGTVEEKLLYEEVKRLSEKSELGIRLYESEWSRFDVSRLTLRQREVFGRKLASRHDWLSRTLPEGSGIGLFATGPARGYLFAAEKPRMLVKSAVGQEEPEISLRAGELEVGPKVFEANEDYIAETVIKEDKNSILSLFSPDVLGMTTGKMFRLLHDNGITYGDVFFSNDPPQLHLLSDGHRAFLIDYDSAEFSGDLELDYKKIIISLENLAAVGGMDADKYTRGVLSYFSEAYGREIRRQDFPKQMSQMLT